MPDVGLVTMDEMAAHAERVADAVDIPVIADGENGWNNAANIWRTVRSFEQAGVCGIHIEDHEFGKHADVPQVLLSCDAPHATRARIPISLSSRGPTRLGRSTTSRTQSSA
jgi:methylisocitrate lyase